MRNRGINNNKPFAGMLIGDLKFFKASNMEPIAIRVHTKTYCSF